MNQRWGIHVFGNPAGQTWFDLFFLNEVLTYEKFDVIIEVCTHGGGLTVFFGMHMVAQGAHVITFDPHPEPEGEPWDTHKKMLSITHYNLDVFDPKVVDMLEIIISENRVLIYCDGTQKPHEFKTFAPMLQEGDVIMVHDKGREIYDGQITTIVEEAQLKPFHQTDADWVGADIYSFIKRGDDDNESD